MEKNRSHGKIDNLPENLKNTVDSKLLEGYTYEDISNYLKDMGHDVHLSSVHRYGKPFLKKFENVRNAKTFACFLAEDNVDRPTTEIHEANNAIVSQIVMELLVSEDIDIDKKLKMVKQISSLQTAQVANERLKIYSRKEAGAVRASLNIFKEKVFDEIKDNYPELADEIVKIASDVEKDLGNTI